SLYVCLVNRDGAILGHRHMQAAPDPFLQAVAPSREGLVVAVECLVTGSWRAALCAEQGMPVVLGHALSMNAIQGGQATHAQIDAHNIAALLRGGRLPHA